MKKTLLPLLLFLSFFLFAQRKELQDTMLHNYRLYEDDLYKGFSYSIDNIKIAEKSGDIKKIGYAHLYLGLSYAWEMNYKFALEEYSKALEYFEKTDDTAGIIKCYFLSGVSTANKMPSDFNSSNVFQMKALALCRKYGDTLFPAYCYHELSANYISMQQQAIGVEYARKALNLIQYTRDYGAIINDYHSLASIYMSGYESDKALPYAQEGIRLAEQHHSLYQATVLSFDLSVIYANKNDFANAYRYSSYANHLKDSLKNIQNTRLMHDIAAKYQSEEKEQEVEKERFIRKCITGVLAALILFSIAGFFLYKRRRDALQKQKDAEQNLLVMETEMKALRAQMNPHFIFNSLNSIYNFIAQNNSIQASEYLSKFSKLMRLILDNSRQKEVILADEIEALQLYLELEVLRLKHTFSFTIELGSGINPDATYIPPMMLQPFVENSIWHGFNGKEGKGSIYIRINNRNDYLICEIEDNGIGRKNSSVKQSVYTKESLALTITNERITILNTVNKLKSSLQVIDLKEGVKVLLHFPYIVDI